MVKLIYLSIEIYIYINFGELVLNPKSINNSFKTFISFKKKLFKLEILASISIA